MKDGVSYRIMWQLRSSYIVQYPDYHTQAPRIKQTAQNSAVTNARGVSTFSADAKKRFQKALDNLCLIYLSAEAIKPSILFHEWQGKTHKRKLVFLTLTVPQQSDSDASIKRSALGNFLDNLRKHWGLNVFVWKAEAQARGAIHFHLVLDTFIPEARARKMWYNTLRRLGCIPSNLLLSKASKLTHFKVIKDIQTAAAELGDYFEGERDETGKLIHKHDKTKRVRDITGRSWGCSDNLRYDNFSIYSVCDELESELYHPSIRQVDISDDQGNKRAELYFTKSTFYNVSTNSYSHREAPLSLRSYLYMYHFAEACKIYNHTNDSTRFDKAHLELNLFKLANYNYRISEVAQDMQRAIEPEFRPVQLECPF